MRDEGRGRQPQQAGRARGRKAYSWTRAGGMRILLGKSDKLQSRYADG